MTGDHKRKHIGSLTYFVALTNEIFHNQTMDDVVKKVSPYPIQAHLNLVEGQPPFKAHIVKLTDFGFLMQCDRSHYYRVAETYVVQFVIPVFDQGVKAKAKVIKTYDGIEAKIGKDIVKAMTVEMHFVELATSQKEAIRQFLAKIGQK